MKFKFPSIDKHVGPGDSPIKSSDQSPNYVNIPQLMVEQGLGLLQTLKMRAPVLSKMIASMRASMKSASSIVENPKNGKKTISEEELKDLESFILSLGIVDIGYAKVTPELIFKGHQILYENAIVLVMKMEEEAIEQAPSKTTLKEVFRTYHQLGLGVNSIADYLRSRGFSAMAGPAIGGDVSYPPLAERAGLGAMGRHGLLITAHNFGPCLRLATVYTEIENLPFAQENEHLWIKDFCRQCKKCVKSCPSVAIYENLSPKGRSIDRDKCAKPFSSLYGCSLCVKNCTFFSGEYDKLRKNFLKNKAEREKTEV